MRLSNRRNALRMGLGGALLGGLYGWWHTRRLGADAAQRIEVAATPIPSFLPSRPDERRFGALAFRSGAVLTSSTSGFGGLSGLWRDPAGGRRLVAVTDHAQWLTAEIVHDGAGRLAGLAAAGLSPVLGKGGVSLRRTDGYDCESLAIADGIAHVGIERRHQVLRFAFGQAGPRAEGEPIGVPADLAGLGNNGGIEALAVAPPGHPLAGALIAIAEEAPAGEGAPLPGWVLTGADRFAFSVAKAPCFAATDAAFLATGELLLLERSFSVFAGAGCRIRRIARDAIRPNAVIDGEVIFEADRSFEIDNMEGLTVHRDAASGETVLTLMSDDNFMRFQRTLLLEFTLPG